MTEEGFLAALAQALGDESFALAARAGLEERVRQGVQASKRRWPEAPPVDEDFARHVAARLTSGQAPLHEASRRLRFEELYLAWWAGSGDRGGITAFEAAFESELGQLLARFDERPAEEQKARLRIKLFVGTGSAPARVREYSGFVALEAWLRATAARMLVEAMRTGSEA
jgi:hypothetical protein